LGLSPDGAGCITAGNDGELKVWQIDTLALAQLANSVSEGKTQDVLTSQGIIRRQGSDRTIGVSFHPSQDYIAIHGSEKAVEIWRIRSADELHKHMQRKRKRRREKAAAAGETLVPETDEAVEKPDVIDVFTPYVIVRSGGRVRSASWVTSGLKASKTVQILIATTNNLLELYNVTSQKSSKREVEYARSLAVELPGHRADIRTLALSSDDRMLASASARSILIVHRRRP
jgi:U3 small nucleolar RNA-associated protein 12